MALRCMRRFWRFFYQNSRTFKKIQHIISWALNQGLRLKSIFAVQWGEQFQWYLSHGCKLSFFIFKSKINIHKKTNLCYCTKKSQVFFPQNFPDDINYIQPWWEFPPNPTAAARLGEILSFRSAGMVSVPGLTRLGGDGSKERHGNPTLSERHELS